MSALVALVLPTGVYATSAMASAQTTTTTTGKVAVVVAGSKLSVSPDMASRLSSPEGWSDLTMDQLASAGIHPGMGSASSGRTPQAHMVNKSTPVVTAAGMVHPDSANPCDQRVCIHVYGAGLYVNSWSTSAANSVQLCTYAAYWVNGVVASTSKIVCGNGDAWAHATYNPAWRFANNAEVCNTWVHLAGKPCASIHS